MDEDPSSTPGRPSVDPRVSDALAVLAAKYPDAIDPVALAGALDDDRLDSMAAPLNALMRQHRLVEAAELATMILGLSAVRSTWLRPITAFQCIRKLYELGAADSMARMATDNTMLTLKRWRARWADETVWDEEAERTWVWLDELCQLPIGVPEPFVAVLVAAAAGGDIVAARPGIAELAQSDPDDAHVLLSVLRTQAPATEEAVGFLLLTREERQSHVHAPAAPPVTGKGTVAFAKAPPKTKELLLETSGAMVDTLTRQVGVHVTAGRVWGLLALLIGIACGAWGIHQLQLDSEPVQLDPAAQELEFERQELCIYLGEGTPGCMWAGQVTRNFATGDCERLRDPMRKLEREVRASEGFSEFSTDEDTIAAHDAIVHFVEVFRDLCL